MKNIRVNFRELGFALLCTLAFITMPMASLGFAYVDGSEDSFQSMSVFGTMTCEWTDGHQALMAARGGTRRLYDMEGHKVIAGVTYKFKRGMGSKVASAKPSLEPVK